MEFPSILLQFEIFFKSTDKKKLFPIIAISIDEIPRLMMMFIGTAVVDENRKKFRIQIAVENNSVYGIEWDTALHNYSSGFHKSFPYANTFMAQVKHRKKCKHTHANKQNINKMKFIVEKKSLKCRNFSKLFWWDVFFLLLSRSALNRCIASLNYFVLSCSICLTL